MKPGTRSTQLLTRMLLRVREEFTRMTVDGDDLHPLHEAPVGLLDPRGVVNYPAGVAAETIGSVAPGPHDEGRK